MTASRTMGSGLMSTKSPRDSHLVRPGGGVVGELFKLRGDIDMDLGPMANIVVEEWTNPPAASVSGLKTAFATSITAQVYMGAALNGALVGSAAMGGIPRPPSVTASDNSSHAGYTGSVTFKGTDINGKPITAVVAITNNATTVGTACGFWTEADIPAQPDALGSLQLGIGAAIGLGKPVKGRVGGALAVREMVNVGSGAVLVTTGTLAAPAAALPNGSYTPAGAPNGTNDYCLFYEADATTYSPNNIP